MNKKNPDHSELSATPTLSRRQLLAGAGAAVGASMLPGADILAQNNSSDTVIFTHTTVVSNDAERRTLKDVALAVDNGLIAAIGDTDEVLAQFPQAEVYDGRRK
ncbi:MAG: twin-arginine translocation signal domain-containing protein, partial [Pseudomonadales bacterium]|nr:twin-arginine translocation signal domain-containing protein [Pseudomonadales bacterium]